MKTNESMTTLEAIVRAHPFLAELSDGEVRDLAGCAAYMRFGEDDLLFREGELANHFYLLCDGKIALEIPSSKGPVAVQTVEAGDVVGWSWLVPPYQSRFQGRAVEECRVLALDARCLRGKCEENGALGYKLLGKLVHVMAERLSGTRMRVLDLYGAKPQVMWPVAHV